MAEVKITREMQDIKTSALSVYESAKKVVIKDQDSYEIHANTLRSIKTQWAEIESKRKELIRPFQQGVKQINDFFGVPLKTLVGAESLIKKALVAYVNEQEAVRLKEQREAMLKAEKEKEKLEKKATKLEEKGDVLKAEEVRIEADFVPVPVVQTKVNSVKGISYKVVWKYKITDEEKIPRKFLTIDHKTLSGLARSTKGKVLVAGVEFYSEKIAAGARM